MNQLSILCVTRAEPHAISFLSHMSFVAARSRAELVFVADGDEAFLRLVGFQWPHRSPRVEIVHSLGYIESVLDQAVGKCTGSYILRLDDDEQCSPAMVTWLQDEQYLTFDHWKFPRAHLFNDDKTIIMHPQLWPDCQTRLSIKAKSGNRRSIHAGSPYGGGQEAPVVIEHHKFLVKTVAERTAIADRYDRIRTGTGTGGMLAFQLPELCNWTPRFTSLGDGIAENIR